MTLYRVVVAEREVTYVTYSAEASSEAKAEDAVDAMRETGVADPNVDEWGNGTEYDGSEVISVEPWT